MSHDAASASVPDCRNFSNVAGPGKIPDPLGEGRDDDRALRCIGDGTKTNVNRVTRLIPNDETSPRIVFLEHELRSVCKKISGIGHNCVVAKPCGRNRA